MSRIETILARKGGQVVTAEPAGTVLDAAMLMNEHRIGALIVVEGGRVVGMFTERDVLRRVVAKRLDPAEVALRDAMTTDVVCCHPDTRIDEARSVFMDCRIRHLPVVDANDGGFLGVLTRASVHERVVGHLAHARDQLLREHSGLAAFEEQSQLVSLLSGLPSPDAGTIVRVPVEAELVGQSLRDVDYRRTRGGVVLAIQTADRRVISPPDPARPLRADDRLLILR